MSWSEKAFEEKMTPKIDAIYRRLFSKKISKITRSNRETDTDKRISFMDRELAIDTHLAFEDGTILTAQEKTLRDANKKYQHFTFEYFNDPKTKDPGEWFKLGAQLYFFGYATPSENGYSQFWLLDIAKLRIGIMRKWTLQEMENRFLKANKPPAKANFFAIPFSYLGEFPGCVLYKFPREVK